MFISKNENGEYISLLDQTKEQVERKRKMALFCPCCHERVFLKAGRIKLPHFAHAANESCDYASEGESEGHLLGKVQLYGWLKKCGHEPKLEKYFPEIAQRADLYFENDGRRIAVEFQCAVISVQQVKKRTLGYRKIGIHPVWILDARHLKTNKGFSFSITPFLWSASSGSVKSPQILFYSPSLKVFTFLIHPIPFSPKHTFATPIKFPQDQMEIGFLFRFPNSIPVKLRSWMGRKRSWRLLGTRFATVNDDLLLGIYKERLTPASLPHEIGIPVPYMHLYETNALTWQFKLYSAILKPVQLGGSIYRRDWQSFLIQSIQKGNIVLRSLPSQPALNPFLPIEQYLLVLTKLELLHKASEEEFRVLKKMRILDDHSEPEEYFYKNLHAIYTEFMKTGEWS